MLNKSVSFRIEKNRSRDLPIEGRTVEELAVDPAFHRLKIPGEPQTRLFLQFDNEYVNDVFLS